MPCMPELTSEQQLRQAIGARIATIRADRRITQEQLAERVGAAPQTIRRIERGRTTPPLGRLLAISDALGIRLLDLFDAADAPVLAPTWDTEEARVVELYRATPHGRRSLLLDVMGRFAAPR